jgi:CCR4-NOT transcription complex subunit 1
MLSGAPARASPYAYGCQYSKFLIASAIARPQDTSLSTELLALIQNSDFRVLRFVLNFSLEYFSDRSAQKAHHLLKTTLKSMIPHLRKSPLFRTIAIDFFNEQEVFPITLLNSLLKETALSLAVFACHSRFKTDAALFLQTSILPGLNFFVDNDLLYELCALRLPGLNPTSLFHRATSADLMVFAHEFCGDVHEELKFESPLIETPLQFIFTEGPSSTCTSTALFSHILRFFPDFNPTDAATLLLTVTSPDSTFHASPEVYQALFAEHPIDFERMLAALDQPGFERFAVDSAVSFLSIVTVFSDREPIPTPPFTREWQNKPLQLTFLRAIASTRVSGLDFSKAKALLNLAGLDFPAGSFADCNHCWLSLDFVDRVLQLTQDDLQHLLFFFQPLQQRGSPLVLAVLGQVHAPRTLPVITVAIDALTKVMQSAAKEKVLASLWRTSAAFLKSVIVAFYERQPSRIDLIVEAAFAHLQSLYDCNHVPFVVDLAIQAAKDRQHPFSEFLAYYGSRYPMALREICEFVKTRVLQTTASSTVVSDSILNTFFQYLADVLDGQPLEVRALIQRVWLSCSRVRPKLNKHVFEVGYPPAKLAEIKESAARHFTGFVSGNVSPRELLERMKRFHTDDPMLFSCMVFFLVKELNYLQRHTQGVAEAIGELVARLVYENMLATSGKTRVFKAILESLSDTELTIRAHFAVHAIATLLPKLEAEAQFVRDLVHQSNLKLFHSQLFEQVQKLLHEPSRSAFTASLTIHPLLTKFENLQSPPPRVCKEVHLIQRDSLTVAQFLETASEYSDWFALHIVRSIEEQSRLTQSYLQEINNEGSFWKIVFQAAVCQALQLILSKTLDTAEGGLVRRRLWVLGKLIGELTLAQDRPLFSRFLDIKKLLLYAFSQGKLYGVVPFVTAIFTASSPNYSARNPYVAGILQLLAGILKTDSIKQMIKNHIQFLFVKLNVNISMFASVPEFFPDKIQSNFDFLMPPFSLRHLATPTDAEHIALFDETVFLAFIAPHIIIPDSPVVTRSPDLKEHMRHKISKALYSLLTSTGLSMSNIASSTATQLILKDFIISNDTDQMMENAVILSKKLVAGLVFFTAPTRVPRKFYTILRQEADGIDTDWLELIVQRNYEWFIQLLRDVVELRTLQAVRRQIEKSDDARAALLQQRRAHTLPSVLQPPKQSLATQQQQVYIDLSELSLEAQPYSVLDFQGTDKPAKSDPEFEAFLVRCQKALPPGEYARADQLDDTVLAVVSHCPPLADAPFERLRLVIKTVLRSAARIAQPNFDRLVCHILTSITQLIPRQILSRLSDSVLGMIRTTLRSPPIIAEFIRLRVIQAAQLDRALAALLDGFPFSLANAWFVIRLLHYALETHVFAENDVIATLAVLCSVNHQLLETAQPPGHPAMPWFDDLVKLYEGMDGPSLSLSAASKLQFVSTFDPIDEGGDWQRIADAVQHWKAVLASPLAGDSDLAAATRELCARGKHAYVCVFFSEPERVCCQFLLCALEFVGMVPELTAAIATVVGGNAAVLGFDMRKYYAVMRLLLESAPDLVAYAVLLHQLRPLLMPTFALDWVALATDKALVHGLLSSQSTWPSYAVLVLDFAALLRVVEPHERQPAFAVVHRAFLRFACVLAHDFREFLSAIAPELMLGLPGHAVQLRNLVLNARIPGAGLQFPVEMPKALTGALEQFAVDGRLDISGLGHLFAEMPGNPSLVRSFVAGVCDRFIGEAPEASPAFAVLCEALATATSELTEAIVGALLDRIACKSSESTFFIGLVVALYRVDIQITSQVTLAEAILKLVMERAATPPPHPVKLGSLVRRLLAPESGRDIWATPFVSGNKNVREFLAAAQKVFTLEQK